MTDACDAVTPESNEKGPWPWRHIAIGMAIPLVLLALWSIVAYSGLFRYRPWTIMPAGLAYLAAAQISFILYSIYVFRKRGFRPLSFPASVSGALREFGISILYFLSIGLLVGLTVKAMELILGTEAPDPLKNAWFGHATSSTTVIVFLVMCFTVVPISEELFFRGFLYNALKSRLSVVVSVIVQAGFFAVIHQYGSLDVAGVFVAGIALAVVYERRKSLLSPILIHAMINATLFVPILILTLSNLHTPARNWDEAKLQPAWLKTVPSKEIKKQGNGIEQWKYAIETWGTKGSREWKKEVNAFQAVSYWFPEDKKARALAKIGMTHIYLVYLHDYRRAVVEADEVLALYPDQKELCASAIAKKGWAYYYLGDYRKSRDNFNKVLNDFSDYNVPIESVLKGIEGLDALEGKHTLSGPVGRILRK
jgi:membrane protease YdiL (CAAX protease family)